MQIRRIKGAVFCLAGLLLGLFGAAVSVAAMLVSAAGLRRLAHNEKQNRRKKQ